MTIQDNNTEITEIEIIHNKRDKTKAILFSLLLMFIGIVTPSFIITLLMFQGITLGGVPTIIIYAPCLWLFFSAVKRFNNARKMKTENNNHKKNHTFKSTILSLIMIILGLFTPLIIVIYLIYNEIISGYIIPVLIFIPFFTLLVFGIMKLLNITILEKKIMTNKYFCKYCGSQINNDTRSCNNCGKK